MEPLLVSIGSLRSISEFHFAISSQLGSLRKAYESNRPICWDLRPLQVDGHQSIAALTCFMAFAYRVGLSAGSTPTTKMIWNRRLLSFLNSVGVIGLVRQLSFLEWQDGMVGGFEDIPFGAQIEFFRRPDSTPSYGDEDWGEFKDELRPRICEKISIRLKPCLETWRVTCESHGRKHDRLIESIAELVLNCWTWGEESAFVGMQLNKTRLTVAVVDSGRGFLQSMRLRQQRTSIDNPNSYALRNDLEAIAISTVLNHEFYALRGAINFVVGHGGWVHVGSYFTELNIQKQLWDEVECCAPDSPSISFEQISKLTETIGKPFHGTSPSTEARQRGYSRIWSDFLVGSRVVFEIKADENG